MVDTYLCTKLCDVTLKEDSNLHSHCCEYKNFSWRIFLEKPMVAQLLKIYPIIEAVAS
jgi:hypothetical protein